MMDGRALYSRTEQLSSLSRYGRCPFTTPFSLFLQITEYATNYGPILGLAPNFVVVFYSFSSFSQKLRIPIVCGRLAIFCI